MGRVREEKRRRKKTKKRKSPKKEDPGARKGRKVAKHCVFPTGSGGSKSRLAKAAGAEPYGQMRDEKVHAVVARSTFPSQNVQSTPASLGALLEVEMSKKCMPFRREAHFEVKMYKTPQLRSTVRRCDVEKVNAVVARSTCRSQNLQSTTCTRHFWTLERRFAWQAQGIVHLVKSEQNVSFFFVAFRKPMASVGHLKRICKDAFSVAGAVQETSSSEMLGGPGADFLRGVAFWSIRSVGLLR